MMKWRRQHQKRPLRRQPVHAIDLVPTVLEIARVPERRSQSPPPLHGRSFAAALASPAAAPAHDSLWWCHEGHRAVRMGDWKLVAARGEPWAVSALAAAPADAPAATPAANVAKAATSACMTPPACRSNPDARLGRVG